MAQYRINDPEDLLQCPYEASHMIRAKRFAYHLMRCRNNYSGRDFASCPFNAKHEMPRPELRYHITTCPDKAMLEPELRHSAQKSGDENVLKGCTDMPERRDFDIACSEDWDTEAAGPVRVGVDPAHYNRVRFKDLTGMSTSEKKFIRQNANMPVEQAMRALMGNGANGANEPEQLRLPKTTPVAMAAEPKMKPKPQPTSAVFAYSIGRGRGQPATNGVGPSEEELYNRQMARNPAEEAPPTVLYDRGIGRGLGEGRGLPPQMAQAPPPGFRGRGRGLNLMNGGPSFVVPKVGKPAGGEPPDFA